MRDVAVSVARTDPMVVARAFLSLTKPGITAFVGMSAAAGYAVAARNSSSAVTLLLVLSATMLMSSGAAALNQVAERDLDARMKRTARRALPSGAVAVDTATWFGWTLAATGALIAITLLPLAVFALLAACHVSYVYIYTPMKVRTQLCTLVGAIPGALPVMAGAAAAGATLHPTALALTGLLFMWQIPHFMAIGWVAREDYARAGFALLPVIDRAGVRTALVALAYAIATHGFAILVTRDAHVAPLTMAVVHTAGTFYYLLALPFLLRRSAENARRLFFTSLLVLPVMLGALMLGVVG